MNINKIQTYLELLDSEIRKSEDQSKREKSKQLKDIAYGRKIGLTNAKILLNDVINGKY